MDTAGEKNSGIRKLTDKLYGGSNMSWPRVILFAAASAVLAFLGSTAFECGSACVKSFPHLLIAALFCVLQIVLYVITFFPDIKQKIVGILIPVAVIAVLSVTAPKTDITVIEQLPGSPSFSEEAVLSVEDASFANIQIHSNKDGMLYIKANGYGTTLITITDGGEEYSYTLEIYKKDGITRTRITPQQ